MHLAIRVLLFIGLTVAVCMALPHPDSAGIVERVNGLAYGGIPYGSISGMLQSYRPHNGRVYHGNGLNPRSFHSLRRPTFGGLSSHLINSVYV